MGFFNDIYRKAVFFIGDIRKIDSFPWVTWDVHQHRVSLDEIIEALPKIKYGDVGIHRDDGYLSNIAIPGFMIRPSHFFTGWRVPTKIRFKNL